jgi:hypothetical protein
MYDGSKRSAWIEPPPCRCRSCQEKPDGPTAELHRSIKRLVALTDERSRRLVAGLLAELHGHGGITLLSQITGLDCDTISRGRQELHDNPPLPPERIRRPGGGRKPVEVTRPGS